MKKVYQTPVSEEILMNSESVMLYVSGEGLMYTPGESGEGDEGR